MVEALRNLASRRVPGIERFSDTQIVEMCQLELPNDVTAYRELLRRYEALVYNTCNKILSSASDAEEVAQDVLIQVFHKISQFEGRSSFKTWLYTITRNYCNSRLSKIIRKREGAEKYEDQQALKEDTRENETVKHDVSSGVKEAIDTLNHTEREVLTLKFMTGLTLNEISEVLEIGLSATKMRVYRAMESFKETYSEQMNQQTKKPTA